MVFFETLELIGLIAACGVLLAIAWTDFLTFRILNGHVFLLFVLSVFVAVTSSSDMLAGRFAAGALLFSIGLLFWLLGAVGAGDAKLLLPVGILIGWSGLGGFAVALAGFSILAFGLSRMPQRTWRCMPLVSQRFSEIRRMRVFPYGIPLSFSAMTALAF